MYSKCPVKEAVVDPSGNPIDVLGYFDYPLNRRNNPRLRMLYSEESRKTLSNNKILRLNKYSLFKSHEKSVIKAGHHDLSGCKVSKTVSSAVLHFKFGADYIDHLNVEAKRGVYYNQASAKKRMLLRFNNNPDLSFYDEAVSQEYKGSKQLVELGIIRGNGVY
jgi:hypothetical protein